MKLNAYHRDHTTPLAGPLIQEDSGEGVPLSLPEPTRAVDARFFGRSFGGRSAHQRARLTDIASASFRVRQPSWLIAGHAQGAGTQSESKLGVLVLAAPGKSRAGYTPPASGNQMARRMFWKVASSSSSAQNSEQYSLPDDERHA
jgi:hypothetical protein